jgi:hypothetical protein
MKRLISIGVALALLSLAAAPIAAAGDDYTRPDTYSQIPFSIVGSTLALIGDVLHTIFGTLWGVPRIFERVGLFVGTSVAGGVNNLTGDTATLGGDVFEIIGEDSGSSIGAVADIFHTIACALFVPFGNYTGTPFEPCG